MSKIARKALIHYVDSTFGGTTASWFKIGEDISDMSVALNPQVETIENIWNETAVRDNGYQPQLDVETYYANPSDSIYAKLKDIALNRLKGDDCKSKYLEVIMDKEGEAYDAWQEDCIVKPTSYGGSTDGVTIPYTVYPDGNRVKGTVTFSSGVPTFVAD